VWWFVFVRVGYIRQGCLSVREDVMQQGRDKPQMTPRLAAAACFIQTMASKAKELYGSTLLSPPLMPSLPSTAPCNGTKSQACSDPDQERGTSGQGLLARGEGGGCKRRARRVS